jgi:hypothetical protein
MSHELELVVTELDVFVEAEDIKGLVLKFRLDNCDPLNEIPLALTARHQKWDSPVPLIFRPIDFSKSRLYAAMAIVHENGKRGDVGRAKFPVLQLDHARRKQFRFPLVSPDENAPIAAMVYCISRRMGASGVEE